MPAQRGMEVQSARPLLAFFAGSDGGVVRDDVRLEVVATHVAQQVQRTCPPLVVIAVA
eukprot:CAMPEP_0179164860 /NCGR_PEP_ID=MMETSP0796-20121207/80949_1 /TAXON_ID=73915 /ORGANISM="Pyrodinium bahamense, Strain pbaha01" /LENGTH=57 /DNA_ID=CAMNT_0020867387 /DNA_START=209 /DNA_END=382 /DNA_ORIENTATION=-